MFILGLIPNESYDEIVKNSKGLIQNAANNLQWEIVNGLGKWSDTVTVLNFPYIGAYPFRYKKCTSPASQVINLAAGLSGNNVSFLNIVGIKHYSRRKKMKEYTRKWLESLDQNETAMITAYALTSDNVCCLVYAKTINPNVLVNIIVPDLPEYMNTSNSSQKLYSVAKKYDIKYISKRLKLIDGYVLLTGQMSNALGVQNYTVLEGIATDAHPEKKYNDSNRRIILYTGTLNQQYGIRDLIDDFSKIEKDYYELWICGYGDSTEYVEQAQLTDERIKYLGILDRNSILKLQTEASILVNPRKPVGEYVKYSFPSKLLEYLASGTPVVAYKLPGVPEEYDPYITYVDENDEDGLKRGIERLCEMDNEELRALGEAGRNFVLAQKTCNRQVERMMLFFEKIASEQ